MTSKPKIRHKVLQHQAQDLKQRHTATDREEKRDQRNTMDGRESKGPPPADLLVCFPSRAHLTLMMPKPICSPARPSEPSKRRHNHKKTSNRGAGGPASPALWAKTKPTGSEIAEPTSPRVTCAGQIKVRPKSSSCKNWQSVMGEIERLHHHGKHKKRGHWAEAFGFKREIMQFLTCLRSIRFDFRCFGTFPTTDLHSDDEEDEDDDDGDGYGYDEDEDYQEKQAGIDGNETSRTVFSQWVMTQQEEQNNRFTEDEREEGESSRKEETVTTARAPPPNALMLMRCRSAPAKSWLGNRREEEEDDEEEEQEERAEEDEKGTKLAMEEKKRSKSLAMVMRDDTDFYKFSSDIVKETWVVGDLRDLLSRSRSSKI